MPRIEGETLVLSGTPAESRREFLEYARPEVYFYRNGEYQRRYGEHFPYARFRVGEVWYLDGAFKIADLSVSIDLDAFNHNGDSYQDLIPIAVTHELEEMWSIYKPGIRCRGGNIFQMNSKAHYYALRQQYRYAFSVGKADRYIHFLRDTLPLQIEDEDIRQQVLEENLAAYSHIKSNLNPNGIQGVLI